MKFILIILSILLLSSPLFGQETGVFTLGTHLLVRYGKLLGIKTPNPNIKDKLKMGNQMVKEHTLALMEESIKGHSRLAKNMVKEHTPYLMGLSM